MIPVVIREDGQAVPAYYEVLGAMDREQERRLEELRLAAEWSWRELQEAK